MKLPEKALQTLYLPEPSLEFGHAQACPNPKDGLFLYGPHNKPSRTREIRIGVVATPEGLGFFDEAALRLKGRVEVPPPGKAEKKSRLHLANFPGIEEAFSITYAPNEFVKHAIDAREVEDATRLLNLHEAVRKASDLYVVRVMQHLKKDERAVDVWVFVLPEVIFERCKPQAKRTGVPMLKGDFAKRQSGRSAMPLLEAVVNLSDEDVFDDIPDFHRQVKAKFLKLGITTQLVRETTLAPDKFLNTAGYPTRHMQDRATVAWNLATGLYYKTQPLPPWKLAGVRPSVCYVGLVFKTIPNHPSNHACCAAQMFLDEGDGVVFRGANGPWKSSDFEFHLQTTAAHSLIGEVLETYSSRHEGPPRELFIHGRTIFNDEEWNAFVSAAPPETNIVGVRIKTTDGDVKLFRDGDYPVLRGTAIILDERNAYLWTNGYSPQLDTYIGPETPNPLLISVLRSKDAFPQIEDVLRDIMGLTKINYNACNFNDSLPVTVRFADKVGDVLVMGSAKGAEKQPFKFYV